MRWSWPRPVPRTASSRSSATGRRRTVGCAVGGRSAAGLGAVAAWLTAAQSTSRRRWTVSASGLEGTEPEVVLRVNSGPASPGEADPAPGRADPAPGDPGAAKGARDVELPPGRRADTGRR